MNDAVSMYEKFDDMNLPEKLLRGIYAYGFELPSVIQQMAIVPFKDGRNIIAQAQSGTGKTGSFSIGLLSRLDLNLSQCQAIILSPTHELAYQTGDVIRLLGEYMKVRCQISVGGTDWREDERILKRGVDVVIGTPGRVYDMLKRQAIDGQTVKILIIDEADQMLDKDGFQDIVHDIMEFLHKNVQIGLFSATMPNELHQLADKFMTDPLRIIVKNEELTLEGIRQFYVVVDENYKFATICDLYKDFNISSGVIFCNTRARVDKLAFDMTEKDFPVSSTHGSMDSRERNIIINSFRSGKSRVLITTDLLSRGIDVQQVSIVINYDFPKDMASYIHRIGRSGRFGRKGIAITFITPDERAQISQLEHFYNTQIEILPSNFAIYI